MLRERLMHWLDRQSPYALITAPNPVFDYELRRTRLAIRERSTAQTFRPLLTLFLVTAACWLLHPPGNILSLFYFPISLLVSFFVDMYYMLLTINTISQQMASGEWE